MYTSVLANTEWPDVSCPTHRSDSPAAGEDFTAIIPVTLTFDESIRENCVDIVILEDQLSEKIEVFHVLLSAYSDQPTVELTENVSVEIVPNEGKNLTVSA